jgi:pyruvate formate lyase activating enzyme
MIFGGIQKTSLIDFPGKVACVLFTPGCNFTCPYCHNPDLARNRMDLLSPLAEGVVLDFLKNRQGLLEGVVITGGEPTLHKSLGKFCEKVKKLGYPIKLDTNGSHPDQLNNLLADALVDYIAMDIKTDPYGYAPDIHPVDQSKSLISCIDSIISSGLPHEFRTTCLAPFVDAHVITRIATFIKGADLYVLQKFKRGVVLDPAFIDEKTTSFTHKNFLDFQSIAAPFVKSCIVR